MLGLPDTATLDACASVERVDDAPPEEVVRDRRRGDEQISWGPGLGNLRVTGRVSEQEPEAWPGGTKLGRRRHREIELERIRQQEDAVDGRITREVGQLYCTPLVDQR